MRNLRDALLNSRTCFRVLMLVAMLSTLTPLSATTAPPLTIKVVNNSSWEIPRLYLSPVDNDNWGPDQLNESSISPGTTRNLNVSWDQSKNKLLTYKPDGSFLSTTVDAMGTPVGTFTSVSPSDVGR